MTELLKKDGYRLDGEWHERVQPLSASDLLSFLKGRTDELVREADRRQDYFNLGDYEGVSPYNRTIGQIDMLIRKLGRTKAEIEARKKHRHEWSEDQFCVICGADGNA